MDSTLKPILEKVANTVRVLSAEAIEKAASGHPGLPLGCAEIGAYLYTQELRHNPKNPEWMGRDRFVLSAGHGSMFLYSLLHLTGYDLSLDELKNFRQLHSKTPGHPEYLEAPGVETTTGPLGQGIAAGTGMAIAHKLLRARFGVELFNSKVFVLAGDGCMMEGISHEAASLAGHMKLNNLVLIYDSNQICLDGTTAECFSDDTAARFEAYGFHVIHIDGHDFDEIEKAFQEARVEAGADHREHDHRQGGADEGRDEQGARREAGAGGDRCVQGADRVVEREVFCAGGRDGISGGIAGDLRGV